MAKRLNQQSTTIHSAMSDTMDEHMKILNRNRFIIVQQLQVERSFLFDYLLSKNVLDRDDYDLVRSERTREQKAAKVLDIIETKGQDGFNHFKDALQLINPNLYETMTGEKATVRDSPILSMTDFLDSGDGLPRLIDQDILSNHLKRVTDDLRDMTLRYNSILKENQQLRKVVQQSTRDKNEFANRIEVLEMMLSEAEAAASKTYSDASFTLMNQYDTIQKNRHVNKDFIIQLQMKLLQSQEKYEEKSRQLDEYTMKYKKLENELFQVNENYCFQRSETKKLSATLKTRTEEAKNCDQLKKQCREKQFKIMELQSNLDDREKELDEIKNWTTALKQRYDTVLHERNEIMAKQHETVENLSLSQNNITDMDIKVKRLNRELMEVKKERDKLEGETTMLKSRLTSEHNAYVKMTDKIEELKAYFNELLETKEKELSEKKEYVEYLQEEVEDSKKELAESKKELTAALNTNDILTCEVRKLNSQYNMTVESLEQQLSAWEKSCEEEEEEDEEEDHNDEVKDRADNSECCKPAIRRLSTADLLKSIRRRFQSSLSQPCPTQQEKVHYVKSHSADFSGQRGSKFKIRTLPYDALSCMYSGSTETNDELLRSTLPGFYNRERMQHSRKGSSPLPLSVSDAHYLNSIAHESFSENQELENQGNTTQEGTSTMKESDRSDAGFRPRSCVVRRHSDISHTKNSTTLSTLKQLCEAVDDCS